ncbi:MAG TPA: hypothetical protein PKD78_01570 [Saprospiraceae bacterium]|nr:hypothetical protein [Saprospiraceae bacterium]
MLRFPLRGQSIPFFPRARHSNAQLDTLSSCYWVQRQYVEIIRQDDPTTPRLGVALGFEFDEEADTYPYTPSHAVIQVKDFRWGGVEFGQRDTFNYTGVANEISEDIQVEVDSFRNDTLYGRFSGLLLSGSDQMGALEDGVFVVKIYRK